MLWASKAIDMDVSLLFGALLLGAGLVIVLVELHTLTIYLLALAAALWGASGLAFAGGGIASDLALMLVILILGMPTAYWARRRLKNGASEDVSDDDVGRNVRIIDAHVDFLRVDYRGSTWNAKLVGSHVKAVLEPGDSLTIVGREGNLLLLAP